ncbi:hypothetical protein ILUMI_09800 [Ignelater luminosus]|uniref:Uncharacterized protein n=1 Tax=Ignelater luminosus TaxID=2038154 RepID=A0A8K0D3H6_IGNLU|nr:hypothetical protein ILUMI_09800 [Ignelater luminosus]
MPNITENHENVEEYIVSSAEDEYYVMGFSTEYSSSATVILQEQTSKQLENAETECQDTIEYWDNQNNVLSLENASNEETGEAFYQIWINGEYNATDMANLDGNNIELLHNEQSGFETDSDSIEH